MSVLEFIASLPALLAITGFVVYYILKRNRTGDRITLEIVGKLRREHPDRLPSGAEKLTPAALARLVQHDSALRAKVSEQDFTLLRDTLRHQFITLTLVYSLCAVVFLSGVGLYAYVSSRPQPLKISSISAASTDPAANGLPVDLDDRRIRWLAAGDPEDVAVSLEAMDTQQRTRAKTVRSSNSQVIFSPDDYRDLLANRSHGGENRLRVVIQSAKAIFVSPDFELHVGTTILAVRMDPLRIKITGMIDNSAIPFYDFDAKLLLWANAAGAAPSPLTIGGAITYGNSDFELDASLHYRWDTAKLMYFGPDDPRTVRTQLLNF